MENPKRQTKRLLAGLVLVGLLATGAIAGESTYEFYVNAGSGQLDGEVREMGRTLRSVFDERAVTGRQRQIDFAEYYSHLTKALLYGTKLATYGEYGKDLQFARDNEVFRALPEDRPDPAAAEADRKAFIREKYDRMRTNVEEEIGTYMDLLQISLDACENLSESDLSGFLADDQNRMTVHKLQRSEEYTTFTARSSKLGARWPELARRIVRQFALWEKSVAAPGAPLIDRRITGVI